MIPTKRDPHEKELTTPPRFVAESNETLTVEPSALNVADCITGVGGAEVTVSTLNTLPLRKETV